MYVPRSWLVVFNLFHAVYRNIRHSTVLSLLQFISFLHPTEQLRQFFWYQSYCEIRVISYCSQYPLVNSHIDMCLSAWISPSLHSESPGFLLLEFGSSFQNSWDISTSSLYRCPSFLSPQFCDDVISFNSFQKIELMAFPIWCTLRVISYEPFFNLYCYFISL